MNKSELRKRYLNLRKKLIETDYKSKIIVEKILDENEYKESKVIGLYSSIAQEVDLTTLIDSAIKDKKIVCLPVVLDNYIMSFCKISSITDVLSINKYKIKEPLLQNSNLIMPSELDLIIVPGVCFDTNKNRIGFGQGYYDRYLERAFNSYNIGVCFDEQLIKNFCIESGMFDKKVDEIITDKIKIK